MKSFLFYVSILSAIVGAIVFWFWLIYQNPKQEPFSFPKQGSVNNILMFTNETTSIAWVTSNPFGLQTIVKKEVKLNNVPITTNRTNRIIITTIETGHTIITTNQTGHVFVKTKRPVIHVSLPLAWATYHHSIREKYHFPPGLWEGLFTREEMDDLIDPTTIPHEEWERFIDIACQKIMSFNKTIILNKEAVVIDFKEDFVYVLFLNPRIDRPIPGYDFVYWVKIDRKTGEVFPIRISS